MTLQGQSLEGFDSKDTLCLSTASSEGLFIR